jgi:hypothetical protein
MASGLRDPTAPGRTTDDDRGMAEYEPIPSQWLGTTRGVGHEEGVGGPRRSSGANTAPGRGTRPQASR